MRGCFANALRNFRFRLRFTHAWRGSTGRRDPVTVPRDLSEPHLALVGVDLGRHHLSDIEMFLGSEPVAQQRDPTPCRSDRSRKTVEGGAVWVGRTAGAMDGAYEPTGTYLRRVLPTHTAPPSHGYPAFDVAVALSGCRAASPAKNPPYNQRITYSVRYSHAQSITALEWCSAINLISLPQFHSSPSDPPLAGRGQHRSRC